MARVTKRSFLEICGRPARAEKTQSWWVAQKTPPPLSAVPSSGVLTVQPARTRRTFGKVAPTVAVVLAACLLIATHVAAYRAGLARRDAGMSVGSHVGSSGAPADVGLAISTPQALGPFVTLQLVTVPTVVQAREIAAGLTASGVRAFARRVGRQYTVNVGQFPDRRTAEASGLKERLRVMEYNGRRWFDQCFFVQVTDTGSVLNER